METEKPALPAAIQIQKVISDKSIAFKIKNASDETQPIRLFDAANMWKAVNHEYVIIYTLTQYKNNLYAQFLERLHHFKIDIKSIYLSFNGKAPSVFTANLVEKAEKSNEVVSEKLIEIKKSPYQQQIDF